MDGFCELFHVVRCFCSARRESSVFVFLEDRLRALPSFRRLAFEEIHTAGHWGRKLSGGGSSAEITMPLANHLLQFLQTAPGAWAVESHACMMNN